MNRVVVALLLGLLFIPPAQAGTVPVHWRRGNHPLVITVYDQTADSLWDHALRKLTGEWNAGIHHIAFVISLAPADCGTGAGAFSVVVCIRQNRDPNHVGETALYSDGEHITYALIWMDPRPHPAMAHLACHELGHALGVAHRPAGAKSCMVDGYVEKVEHPDQADFDGVSLAYSHVH